MQKYRLIRVALALILCAVIIVISLHNNQRIDDGALAGNPSPQSQEVARPSSTEWEAFESASMTRLPATNTSNVPPEVSTSTTNAIVDAVMLQLHEKGIVKERADRLRRCIQDTLVGTLLNDYECYRKYTNEQQGTFESVAEAVVRQMRDLSFSSDADACWDQSLLEPKLRRIWLSPALRRARCASVDLSTLQTGTKYQVPDSPLAKKPGMAFGTIVNFPNRVALTNGAQQSKEPCVWISFECRFMVEHDLLTSADKISLAGKAINDPMLVTIYFVEDTSRSVWMPFIVIINGAQAWPRLLL